MVRGMEVDQSDGASQRSDKKIGIENMVLSNVKPRHIQVRDTSAVASELIYHFYVMSMGGSRIEY